MNKRRIASAERAAVWGKVAAAICVTIIAFVIVLAARHTQSATIGGGPALEAQGYKLVFADDFDTLNLGSGDSKAHTWYRGVWFSPKEPEPANISAGGSVLSLTWTGAQGQTDTSISTLSHDKRQFKAWRYGYFEARMRWEPVKGAWPAFWLIPVQDATEQDIYNGTRRSGEIDIFEGQGDQPHIFYGTIHEWLNSHTDHASRNNAFQLPHDADVSQFHIYGVLWTPGKVTWYYDNRPLHSEQTPAIFDQQDFFMVLTMQEGVNWKGGDLSGVTAPRMTLNVDWVRVWQK